MKKLSKADKCSQLVVFKVRPAMLAKAKKAAKSKGMTLSAWIRQLLDVAA